MILILLHFGLRAGYLTYDNDLLELRIPNFEVKEHFFETMIPIWL